MNAHLKDVVAASKSGDVEAYLASERALHRVLDAAAGHKGLLALIDSYRVQAERYMRLARDEADLRSDIAKQRALVAACKRRDAEAAETVTREMLERTVDRLAGVFGQASGSDSGGKPSG